MSKSIYDFEVENQAGEQVSLEQYRGKVLLIVNTASKCGFTPQYDGLQALYKQYQASGFEVLGFPCNQFRQQEPASNQEISEFCSLNFGVKFPMFSKIDVNGDNTAPLYKKLKDDAPGLLGSKGIKWNFTKFLINKEGKVLRRYGSVVKPEKLSPDIEQEMAY
ncbi:MAG: glutathione peroxidase [Alteromonadaceae bacterium]|nr:MAG: glutathione peroxidase [Alteromonadaceae bacterium]